MLDLYGINSMPRTCLAWPTKSYLWFELRQASALRISLVVVAATAPITGFTVKGNLSVEVRMERNVGVRGEAGGFVGPGVGQPSRQAMILRRN